MFRRYITATACLVLAACGSLSDERKMETQPIIPARSVQLTESVSISLEAMAAAAAVYLVVDPLAPNWQVQEARLADDLYRLSLKRKRFSGGGDGEALEVINRRAERLAQEHGYTGYQIVKYTEGIDSGLPVSVAQRVSQGVIRLTRAP